jgi:hypothetical protein
VLIPLSRTLPSMYEFRVRSRIFRWYARLRSVEHDIGQRPADELQRELDDIEAKVASLVVPLSHSDELYSLRSHIVMVGKRLRNAQVHAQAQTPNPAEAGV